MPTSSAPGTTDPTLPRFTRRLQPLVDGVARLRMTIQHKLLVGFLGGALLLVGMGGLSVLLLAAMNDRVRDLETDVAHAARAQEMLYEVTAQSHNRALTILTARPEYRTFRENASERFAALLAEARASDPDRAATLERISVGFGRLRAASEEVSQLYDAGDLQAAQRVYVNHERQLAHVLERQVTDYIALAHADIDTAVADFRADHRLLRDIVVGISVAAVLVAMLVGFLLSWSIILPVKHMETALAQITTGRFHHRVRVPNRDEFGQLAHDLNATSSRLEQLFGQEKALARRLAQTNTSLVRASEAKSQFLASVSHELRTPMNAILGFTDALLAGVDGPLNEEQRASLGWVQRGARDLLALINDILDLSRAESGRLPITPEAFDPRELLSAVVAQHQSLAAQKGLSLRYRDDGTPPRVVLDPQLLRQIVGNLVGNALKFTDRGEVEVVSGGSGDRLAVNVRDTGPGIPLDLQEQLFEEFRTGGLKGAGTGLGLTISRRLARAMGGDVTVDSRPGRGSTFRLDLPLEHRPATEGLPSPPPPRKADERVLLSVDDDRSVAPLLDKVLAGTGMSVSPAATADPSAVVTEVLRLRPEAVLLDLLMPEDGGEAVLRALKSHPGTREVPVVIVSVVDAGEVPAGADGFVSKPVTREALLAALAAVTRAPAAVPGGGVPR